MRSDISIVDRCVLGIENSISGGRVSLRTPDKMAATVDNDDTRSDSLMLLIERIFVISHIGIKEIGLIAVSLGPGSFTGTRIGIATALGLKTALDIECVGITTLEAVASSETARDRIAAVPLGRGQYAAQRFYSDEHFPRTDDGIYVLNFDELVAMVENANVEHVCFPNELKYEDASHFGVLTEMTQTIWNSESTAELVCRVAAKSGGHRMLEPVYARPNRGNK